MKIPEVPKAREPHGMNNLRENSPSANTVNPNVQTNENEFPSESNRSTDKEMSMAQKDKPPDKDAFPLYPLIERYYLGKDIVEILEQEPNPENPYQEMPYCDIPQDGVIQIFCRKGTFTQDKRDVPEFRSYAPERETHHYPMMVQGPYKRVEYQFPFGYHNRAKRKTEHRFRKRISPEEVLQRQGSYWNLNRAERVMCQRLYDPLRGWSQREILASFNELMHQCDKLSLQQKRQAFCGDYNLGRYFRLRLKGKARSDLSIADQLDKHFQGSKFRFNHQSRRLEQVKELNLMELDKLEKVRRRKPIEVQQLDVPYILPIEHHVIHPLAKKIRANYPGKLPWELSDTTWMPPELFAPKLKYQIQFQSPEQKKTIFHGETQIELKQVKLFDPNNKPTSDQTGFELSGKKLTVNPNHPFSKMITAFLEKEEAKQAKEETDNHEETNKEENS